ncbi:MAG TPA: UDP-N-acetylmuramoyl-tripeptide--D-alanyl-D-alanine ligase [Variovorax sp.]|nr:UDP-N-acetylmuramoyl-tripeptide--D-alanyl-D-alanine ligase [Variovorax sp.]
MCTLEQLHAWVPGSRLVGSPATAISRVHTDTRSLAAGDLFVALKGERFDANQFLGQAKAAGAVAAIAHGGLEAAGLAGLEVPDSLAALGALANGWRRQFELPLIAVTGSNGKTTVTQMIAAILAASAGPDRSLATRGNFNNEVGVPLTLLRLTGQHQLGVVELGMNHPGEIARLAAIAQPTIALVNNAQREHQEFMATVEAVARENGAVFAALPADGTAVFPHGDAFTVLWTMLAHEGASRRCLTFGEQSQADVSLVDAVWHGEAWDVELRTPLGNLQCKLRIAGRHNVLNAMAATACALAAGVSLGDIARGLETFQPVGGRSNARVLVRADGQPLTVVDDTYNANPDSMRAAIDVLAALPAPHLLVVGDMGEVGNQGPQFHAEIGAWAATRGIECVYALGAESAHSVQAFAAESMGAGESRHFDNEQIEALNDAVRAKLPRVSSVLVKGSRFMKMERVVQAIAAHIQNNDSEETGHA